MAAVRAVQTELIGRESELALVHAFLDRSDGSRVFAVSGEPGIGKSVLWAAAIEAAERRGLRVLSARASDAEAQMSFAVLVDLLDGVDLGELGAVPAPQLHALEVALLRAEPEGDGPGSHAIGLGLLTTVRALAAREPILIALDDVQWVDAASASTLAFAARRLEEERIAFLIAERPDPRSSLEQAFDRDRLVKLNVGPLSLGAVRRLLSERLGLSVPRPLLRRIVDATLGNPLFALELGRTLSERGMPGVGEELPVPETLEDLLGTRVAGLPGPVRRSLLSVALSADLTLPRLEVIVDPGDVDGAIAAGVLVAEDERVRASHPLLAAAAIARSTPSERRALHLELADLAGEQELRTKHLALAHDEPDEQLAAEIAAAAHASAARGAWEGAAELGEHALRLTPEGSGSRGSRVLMLAGFLEALGERQQVTELLTSELDSLPPGGPRVRAWLLLSEGGAIRSYYDHAVHFERALAESGSDAGLRAEVLAAKALNTAAEGVERIREAEGWALEALQEAARTRSDVERLALRGLGWARSLRGLPIDDVCERFRAASAAVAYIVDSPEPLAGLRQLWRGELGPARATLTRFLSIAAERGEAVSHAWLRLNMCELGLRTAEWDDVARLLDEWAEADDGELLITPTYQRCRALLAAGRGLPDEAERWAKPALAEAEAKGYRWQALESSRALGVAALLAHEPTRAVERLSAVWEHNEREGVDEPGAFPVAPDLVEALAALGRLDEAQVVTERLRRLSERHEHPWGLAATTRCSATVRLAAGYDETAARSLEQAAARYEQLGLRFDAARSLLALGRAQRRHRKWGSARPVLERAEALFTELQSSGWVEETRAEGARVGGRPPQPSSELTPAERRVAELAADGLANKEIAQTLFVSVKTVEGHLSHVYAKLGVRSRAQLVRRLSGQG